MVEEPIKDSIDEDESFLEIEDSLIEESILFGAFQQSAESVAYKIDNLYASEDSGRYRNIFLLKKDPPVLTITDSKGNTVEFILTQLFCKHLTKSLNEVNRAYNGYVYKTEDSKLKSFIEKVKTKSVKKAGLGVVIVILLILLFSQLL